MTRRRFLPLLLALVSMFSACRQNKRDIVILFENDVHCAVETYSRIAGLRDAALKYTPHVAVVSAGDFIQGDVIGSLSKGEYIIDLMNTVPYDVTTVGNHEFDYTVARQQWLFDRLTADVVCCNLSTTDGKDLYRPYVIRNYGNRRVAFVGAATPTTLHSSTPTFFMDSKGQVIYDFHFDDTYTLIEQAATQARREGADYVILLSHLGDDTPIANSMDMIRQTRGIDAVLDGHAHHVLYSQLPNADGESVWLLSTGSKGKYIGELHIRPDGTLRPDLIVPDSLAKAHRVENRIREIEQALAEQVNQVVGYSEVDLLDRDMQQQRVVRWQETNLSDWVADAMRVVGGGQIGFMHGGGLRAPIRKGNITLGDLIAVIPFNNRLAKVEMTGQQLLDAMEVSVVTYPIESGDFHIGSGLRYSIDPSIPSSVQWDEQNMFAGVGSTRRIVKMEVQDMKTGKWSDINPKAVYTISGLNYTLLNQGASGMFRYAKPIPSDDMKDTDILLTYLRLLGDTIRAAQYPEDINEKRFTVVEP